MPRNLTPELLCDIAALSSVEYEKSQGKVKIPVTWITTTEVNRKYFIIFARKLKEALQ